MYLLHMLYSIIGLSTIRSYGSNNFILKHSNIMNNHDSLSTYYLNDEKFNKLTIEIRYNAFLNDSYLPRIRIKRIKRDTGINDFKCKNDIDSTINKENSQYNISEFYYEVRISL